MLGWLLQQQALVLLVATFGGMLALLVAETVWPRRPNAAFAPARLINNLALAGINFAAIVALSGLIAGSAWMTAAMPSGGLLHGVHPLLSLAVLLLALDGASYALHRLCHAVPLLWRVHAVHHLDTEVDATTSHRHHTLDAVLSAAVLAPVVAVLGASPTILFAAISLRLGFALVTHANLRLPERADRWLRRVVVTPDFHRLHHRSDARHTDSNFGAMFTLFDHLFGTASDAPYREHERCELGLQFLRRPSDSRVDRLLLLPLRWPHPTRPDGVPHQPAVAPAAQGGAAHPRTTASP